MIKPSRPGDYEFTLQLKSLLEPLKVYIDQRKTIDYTPSNLNNTFIDVFFLVFSGAVSTAGIKKIVPSDCFFCQCIFIPLFYCILWIAYCFFCTISARTLQHTAKPAFDIARLHWNILCFTIPVTGTSHDSGGFYFLCSLCFIIPTGGKTFYYLFKSKPYRISCAFPEKLSTALKLFGKKYHP